MLKRRKKLVVKLLIVAMCTSLTPTTITFAAEKSDTQEKVDNIVQTTGAAVSINEEITTLELLDSEPVNSNIINESGFTFDTKTGTIIKYTGDKAELSIPNKIKDVSVKAIGSKAFRNCTSLTSVTIQNGVTSIEREAFRGCTKLKSIIIPDSITTIGEDAFSICSNLIKIIIPKSVKVIESNVFAGCSSLTSVTIPDSVTSIGYGAFNNCSSLAGLIIPNSVKSIGDFAFRGCSNLTSITISNNVTNIGYYTFSNCSKLTTVVIPNSVTSIDEFAFSGCRNLTNVTIPNSVTNISNCAFGNCSSLKNIIIPSSVTKIGYGAFGGCKSLASITIPSSVKSIGWEAFGECSNLTSIVIPSSVTSIEDGTFKDCSKLTSVTIPSSIKNIGKEAFAECTSLKNITIPNSVKSIGDYAFRACSSLNNVAIPNGVTSIGQGTFRECTSIINISIPDSVNSIEKYAFDGCSSLKSVKIPNSVTNIGKNAFVSCKNAIFYVGSEKVKQLLINSGINTSKIILSGQSSTVKATEVKLNTTKLDLAVGKSGKLTATVLPANTTNKGLKWTTSNSKVATIDQSGNIKAVGIGTAIITCTASDGSGKFTTCTVTVTKPSSVKVTSVKLNTNKLNWTVGKTGTFTATIAPSNASNKDVTWKSSNTKVAIVSSTGKLTAVGVGTAIISCTANDGSGKSTTCTVIVTKPLIVKATSVKLNTTSLNWTVGNSGKLTATVSPSNVTNKGLTWTTSNSKVATIDQSGNIKAVGAGTAVITLKTTDGSNKTATCNVKVTNVTSNNSGNEYLTKPEIVMGENDILLKYTAKMPGSYLGRGEANGEEASYEGGNWKNEITKANKTVELGIGDEIYGLYEEDNDPHNFLQGVPLSFTITPKNNTSKALKSGEIVVTNFVGMSINPSDIKVTVNGTNAVLTSKSKLADGTYILKCEDENDNYICGGVARSKGNATSLTFSEDNCGYAWDSGKIKKFTLAKIYDISFKSNGNMTCKVGVAQDIGYKY